MTRSEWATLCRLLEGCWPQREIRDDAAALWFADLTEFDAEVVKGAILALYRSGREFMPNGAQIRAEVAQQTIDAPPFREAWNLLLAAISAKGSHRPGEVVAWLTGRSPAVAEWAARSDIREIGQSADGDTTVYAQARQHYESVVRRQHRAVTHGGLPPAVVPELRPAAAPRPAGGAIGELVADLAPKEAMS